MSDDELSGDAPDQAGGLAADPADAADPSAPDRPDADGVVRIQLSIPSDVAIGQEVQERIMAVIERGAFADRSIFGMRLALEEAIVNAIKHGNKRDPDKVVQIAWEVSATRALVTIEDQGEGFDLTDVPDPTDFENLDKPSGRGIMLMRNFLTRVEYNDVGNRVELELDQNAKADD